MSMKEVQFGRYHTMGAVKDIFGKEPEQVDLNNIQVLITQRREEARNLEYKSPDILNKPVDLSKWVSALLNADGGLIIIGVCEDDPKKKDKVTAKIYPVRIDFVGKDYNKERIEQLVFSNLRSSTKPDIRIYPVRDSSDPNQVVYLIDIPQGENPPYQAGDDKYYRRLNVTKYAMHHTEIADFFGKRRKPQLILNHTIIATKMEESWFDLRVVVANKGKGVARHINVIESFVNLEIIKVIKGNRSRIDDLRENVHTLQWDENTGIIYPESGIRIWDIRLKFQADEVEGNLLWTTEAEEHPRITGNAKIDVMFIEKAENSLKEGLAGSILLPNDDVRTGEQSAQVSSL